MKKIGIIGCGRMGEAILNGIVKQKGVSPKDIFVSDVDSARLNRIKRVYGCDATFNNSKVAKMSDLIIMAVKPQDMISALGSISACLNRKKLVVSIAAGVTIKKISSVIGGDVPVARVMPNMPALVRKSFSAFSFSKKADKGLMRFAKAVFSSIGDVAEVREKDMDAITAISGSGPAYFFYLVEILIKSGIKLGLTPETAKRAAVKTALGSVELLNKFNQDASILRKMATSKGGTTEAAFKVFGKERLNAIIEKGVRAARDRSKELSGSK